MRVVYCSPECQRSDWDDHKYTCAHYIGGRVNIVTCALAANRSIAYDAAMERWHEMMIESEEARAEMRAEETKHEVNNHPWEHLFAASSQTHSVVAECLPVCLPVTKKHWSQLAWEQGLNRGLEGETPGAASSNC